MLTIDVPLQLHAGVPSPPPQVKHTPKFVKYLHQIYYRSISETKMIPTQEIETGQKRMQTPSNSIEEGSEAVGKSSRSGN